MSQSAASLALVLLTSPSASAEVRWAQTADGTTSSVARADGSCAEFAPTRGAVGPVVCPEVWRSDLVKRLPPPTERAAVASGVVERWSGTRRALRITTTDGHWTLVERRGAVTVRSSDRAGEGGLPAPLAVGPLVELVARSREPRRWLALADELDQLAVFTALLALPKPSAELRGWLRRWFGPVPRVESAWLRVARDELAEGRRAAATERLEALLERASADGEERLVASLTLTFLRWADDDRTAASGSLLRAQQLAPDDTRVLLATAAFELGDRPPRLAHARALWARLRERAPRFPPHRQLAAMLALGAVVGPELPWCLDWLRPRR